MGPFWVKAILGTLVLIVGIIAGSAYLLLGGMCGSDEAARFPSPDGRYDVVVYAFNCGATTGYTTQVAIVGSGAGVPSSAGNVTTIDGVVKVQTQWHGTDSLTLSYDDRAELFGQRSQVRGIRVAYRPLNGSGLQGVFSLHGRVHDESGRPISGALVSWSPLNPAIVMLSASYGKAVPDSGLRTSTDSAGSFSFFETTAPFDFNARVEISKTGLIAASTLVPDALRPHWIVVTLRPSSSRVASEVRFEGGPGEPIP